MQCTEQMLQRCFRFCQDGWSRSLGRLRSWPFKGLAALNGPQRGIAGIQLNGPQFPLETGLLEIHLGSFPPLPWTPFFRLLLLIDSHDR